MKFWKLSKNVKKKEWQNVQDFKIKYANFIVKWQNLWGCKSLLAKSVIKVKK